MAVAKIKILNRFGEQVGEEIVVEGNCLQHMDNPLANAAMTNLVENRWNLESRPWLYGIIPDSGMAETDDGEFIAIAVWDNDLYRFQGEAQAVKWGAPPTK